MKIVIHATAGHLNWSEAKLDKGNRLSQIHQHLENAKKSIQDAFLKESIVLEKADPTGHGGTSTTGNVVKNILFTNRRKLLTEGVLNIDLKEQLEELIVRSATILVIINSSRVVDPILFSKFCKDTYLIVAKIPWINLSPSAHETFAHSAQLVKENGNRGLLNYSESSLEANNKRLRYYRINRARKTNMYSNLTDCMSHLWDKSDIKVAKIAERLVCSKCSKPGHTIRSCPGRVVTEFIVKDQLEHYLDELTVQ